MGRLKRVLIQLDAADYEAASSIAESEGLSFAALVRRVIKLYLRKVVASADSSGRRAKNRKKGN
jgi:hypothetical protein